jgi:hypothetical protein
MFLEVVQTRPNLASFPAVLGSALVHVAMVVVVVVGQSAESHLVAATAAESSFGLFIFLVLAACIRPSVTGFADVIDPLIAAARSNDIVDPIKPTRERRRARYSLGIVRVKIGRKVTLSLNSTRSMGRHVPKRN